ncbi:MULTISPECIES: GNAT family N-acetyltransferase [unclassified Pseudomonas]|uniref:GNAT family N-acetyltransferase n=1 Tax=unclassified Pseudomonas TaxID=196821 RepID=UPI00129E21FA|nr:MULTISPECIES: GNAT family N-acetyltransferase [unclassified Pseudomonas]MDH4655925.1 GNAT family N-acetyltransferase [Pseudomonas sp. BN606]MRK21451.1 GNAT family N-acetyltransferase [Pseudomonas sp. JG-B]
MSPAPLDIRPLSAADHAAWLPLWQGYQRFYKTEIPAETTAVTWQRFLDPAEPMHAALAWQGGKAVGLVHFIYHRSCWTVGDYCYLQDLYVAEGLRGGGIGRQLIEHVYAQARTTGVSRVHWLTHETNTDAMQLYDRIADRSGFVQYRKIL